MFNMPSPQVQGDFLAFKLYIRTHFNFRILETTLFVQTSSTLHTSQYEMEALGDNFLEQPPLDYDSDATADDIATVTEPAHSSKIGMRTCMERSSWPVGRCFLHPSTGYEGAQ